MKVFLLVVGLLIIIAGIVMMLSKRDVERAMLDSETAADRNVVQLVKMDIAARYRSLLAEKVRTIIARKQHLRETSGIVQAALERFASLADRGLLSEKQARLASLDWLAHAHLDDSGRQYVFAFDVAGHSVSFPQSGTPEHDPSQFVDYKGRRLIDAVRDETERYGQTFSTFRRKAAGQEPTVAKFGHFFLFSRWNWVVGTVDDVGDVETDVRRKIDDFVISLRETMPEIRLARTGTVFIFDGHGQVVVPPRDSPHIATASNPLTGNLLLDDLKSSATEDGTTPLLHVASDGERLESHASYFKVLDWYVVSTTSTEEVRRPARQLISRQAVIFVVVLLFSGWLGYLLAGRLAKPLTQLTRYANDLSGQDFSSPPSTTASVVPRAGGSDEVGRLATAFAFMESSLRDNIGRLMEATAARQRIESELTIARDIQNDLLPKIFPHPPKARNFELFATLISAREVGGDLYDFYFLDDRHLCFTVGDVCGKGVPAALFMAVTKTLIKGIASRLHEPAQILARVNDELAADNPNMMFVTLVVGILDIDTGTIHYSNAGHNPPLLRTAAGDVRYLTPAVSGMACGVMEDMCYETETVTLRPSDTFILYTDGVTEAMDAAGEVYADDKLLKVAADLPESAQKMVDTIVASVDAHANGADQSDDITVLALRYRGALPIEEDAQPGFDAGSTAEEKSA
jgi:sigma-B regulation protein RsbU (phosphoserine phosphatase)